MSIRTSITDAFLPNIVTDEIFLGGAMTGSEVATKAYNALCTAAENAGYTCNGSGFEDDHFCGPGPDSDPNSDPNAPSFSCCQCAGSGVCHVTCQQQANPQGELKGVRLDWGVKDSGDYGVELEPFASTKLQAVNTKTKAGNTIVEDILPRFCLRVDRSGGAPDGVIGLTVTRTLLGQPLSLPLSVDSTGLDDAALHEAIGGALEALPLDLGVAVLPGPGDACEFDGTFDGPVVSITNILGQSVTAIGVSGLEGQEIIVEQSRPSTRIQMLGSR